MKKFPYPFMEDFLLTFPNKRMEEEYNLIQGQTNVDNTKVTLYFVVFLLLIPGVPALIDGYYWDAGITGMVGVAIILINFLKIIPRQYVQFLIALVICSFDDCLFLMPSNSLSSSSKGLMFFRGYAFASINVALISRFATLWQKMVFLIFGYGFRFVLVIMLDPASAQVQTIIRHIYIDLFIIYTHFLDIKKKRQIFKKFYEYREELTKFKELLANYLPQSISIFKDLKEKPLFLNKSFAETFDISQKLSGVKTSSLIFTPVLKPKLKDMTVDLSSVSEIGAKPSSLNFLNKVESFENVFAEIQHKKILDQKAVSLSASTDSQDDYKSFEVILMKIKWDSEDAIAIILNDITNQEKIIHLRISDANKDRIIATVSHELRTPLNGILGILEIIRKRTNDIKTLEYINLCKDNGHLLLNLVNSLLDLNQIREGKLTTNPTTIGVKRVLEDVIKLFAFQCNQKGITINLQVCQKAPKHVYTDENRLKQILINLISNSLKFTSKGGITVELDQDPDNNDYLQIAVVDTGIGIKEEDQGKLFQMYEKIEHGRSVNKNGVGLGLTISNTLAGILSGKKDERVIEVESEVNKGSKFSFKILKNLGQYDGPYDNSLEKDLSEVSHHSDIEEHDTPEDFSISKAKPESTILFQNIPTKIERHSFVLKPISAVFYDTRKSSPNANLSPFSGSCESSEAQQFVSNNTQRSNQRERGCVLIVDDNPFNILVAQNMLQTIGYTSEIAQGGQEAIEIVKQRGNLEAPFAAILMDCQMPIIDGFEATRILKDMIEKEEVPNSPIIALTANSSAENIKRCYESGMVNCLAKPLLVSELEKAFLEIMKF